MCFLGSRLLCDKGWAQHCVRQAGGGLEVKHCAESKEWPERVRREWPWLPLLPWFLLFPVTALEFCIRLTFNYPEAD